MINFISYLKELNEIGQKTSKFADLFGSIGELNATNLDELKLKKEAFLAANLGYAECEKDIRDLKPPAELFNEHNEIIKGYRKLVEGTEDICNSVDLEILQIDNNIYNVGLKKLTDASTIVQTASDSIVNKIK